MEETLINSRQGWLGCGNVHVMATCVWYTIATVLLIMYCSLTKECSHTKEHPFSHRSNKSLVSRIELKFT